MLFDGRHREDAVEIEIHVEENGAVFGGVFIEIFDEEFADKHILPRISIFPLEYFNLYAFLPVIGGVENLSAASREGGACFEDGFVGMGAVLSIDMEIGANLK